MWTSPSTRHRAHTPPRRRAFFSTSIKPSSSSNSTSTGDSHRSQLLDAAELVSLVPTPRRSAGEELPQQLFPTFEGNLGSFVGPSTPSRSSFDTLTSLPASPTRPAFSTPPPQRLSPSENRRSLDLSPHSVLIRAGRRPSLPSKGVSFLELESHPSSPPSSSRKLRRSPPSSTPLSFFRSFSLPMSSYPLDQPPLSPTTPRRTLRKTSRPSSPETAGGGSRFNFRRTGSHDALSSLFQPQALAPPTPDPLGLQPPNSPFSRTRTRSSAPPTPTAPVDDMPSTLAPPPSFSTSSLGHSSTLSRRSLRPSAAALLQAGAAKLKKSHRQSRFLPIVHGEGGLVGGVGEASMGDQSGRQRELSRDSSVRTGTEDDAEKGFFAPHFPLGGFDVQTYARELPYFVSYSNNAHDWDALRTASLFLGPNAGSAAFPLERDEEGNLVPTDEPPRRVLDLGCGTTPHWILEMSQCWRETEFVGLDAAPTSVLPQLLPADISQRFQAAQHDFKQRLPFEDDEFDFVRMSFLNLTLAEEEWAAVIEEGMRVLKPGCFFEVVESDFSVWRKHVEAPPSSPSSISSSSRRDTVEAAISSILRDRWINPSPLTMVPSTLAMNSTQLRSTGRITLPIPADPSTYDASSSFAFPSEPSDAGLASFAAPLSSYSTGGQNTTVLEMNEIRVILASYADLWSSSSFGVATAAVSAQHRQRERSISRTSSISSAPSTFSLSNPTLVKEVHDISDVLDSWAEDLKSRAGIAQMLSERMGWECKVDREMFETLEGNLPVYEQTLKELLQTKEVQEGVFGEVDPEIDYRLAQLESGKREAEAELRAVRTRLCGPEGWVEPAEGAERETLGAVEVASFVCKAL